MNILAAAVTDTAKQPDYIALALVAAMLIVVVILVIRKHLASKKPANTFEVQEAQEQSAPVELAPGSAGSLKLHDVSPKTAAILMAIVANKLDKPLNELRFISVKEIK